MIDPSEPSLSNGATRGATGEVAAMGEEGAAARSALTAGPDRNECKKSQPSALHRCKNTRERGKGLQERGRRGKGKSTHPIPFDPSDTVLYSTPYRSISASSAYGRHVCTVPRLNDHSKHRTTKERRKETRLVSSVELDLPSLARHHPRLPLLSPAPRTHSKDNHPQGSYTRDKSNRTRVCSPSTKRVSSARFPPFCCVELY